jgi:hypothetical protein
MESPKEMVEKLLLEVLSEFITIKNQFGNLCRVELPAKYDKIIEFCNSRKESYFQLIRKLIP